MKKTLLLFLPWVFLTSGCGIFETRTPEAPQQGRSDFQPPTSPIIVVENLQNAIADLDVNNYIACLSDSNFGGRVFTFSPSPKAGSQYSGIFLDWNRTSEENYFNTLKSYSSGTSSPVLTLSNETLLLQGPDSAYYSANYTLIWPNKGPGDLQEVQGILQFYVGIDNNQNWSIYRWIDSGTSDSLKTWSDLKAQFNQ